MSRSHTKNGTNSVGMQHSDTCRYRHQLRRAWIGRPYFTPRPEARVRTFRFDHTSTVATRRAVTRTKPLPPADRVSEGSACDALEMLRGAAEIASRDRRPNRMGLRPRRRGVTTTGRKLRRRRSAGARPSSAARSPDLARSIRERCVETPEVATFFRSLVASGRGLCPRQRVGADGASPSIDLRAQQGWRAALRRGRRFRFLNFAG